ncbi:MAG TPA: hypothetical protein VNI83_13415 [Vicinamibacterales bacterium]|nr:hypothetical protein [Vicinamibacterales bacterium]
MTATRYPRPAAFRTAEALRRHLEASGIDLPLDDGLAPPDASPLARPIDLPGGRAGNRFCILPMEGWDGTPAGEPSELTRRRWRNFGRSGAKLVWGEATAVRADGRANPRQLVLTEATKRSFAALRAELVAAHVERFGPRAADDLVVGLQLTHSGRYSRPWAEDRPEPLAAVAHPWLDRRFPGGVRVLSDAQLDALVDDFVRAARHARDVGFQFVDIKHCHGYLLHELLAARARPGPYGGSLENRTRFMREVIDGIRRAAPGLALAVRLSVFDSVPFRRGPDGRGIPEAEADGYDYGFGLLRDDRPDDALDDALAETRAVLAMLEARGVRLICTTAGSPYYSPHLQRPAAFPPIDGYDPPEDPLRGAARQIAATARLKAAFPGLVFVGSAYTYLQDWLPHVAQRTVAQGLTDLVGLGRMALAYPDLPADLLEGRPLRRKSICRTFSDCTTGPRLGLVSGCYPLDPFYGAHPDGARLRELKARARA